MNTPQNIKNVKSIVREPSTVMASPGQIPPRRRKVSSTSSSQEVSCICLPSFVFFHCLPIFKIDSQDEIFSPLPSSSKGRAASLSRAAFPPPRISELSRFTNPIIVARMNNDHWSCQRRDWWSSRWRHACDENCGNQLVVTVFNQRSIGASTLTVAQVSIKMTLFPAPGALTVECLQNCGSQKRFTGLPSLRSPP